MPICLRHRLGLWGRTLYMALIGAVIATGGVFIGGWVAPFVPLKVQQRMILALIFASAGDWPGLWWRAQPILCGLDLLPQA